MENKRFVYAIRIFNKDGYKPMAELAFGEGGKPTGETVIIPWDDIAERSKYVINAYTCVWDERYIPTNMTFNEYVNSGKR